MYTIDDLKIELLPDGKYTIVGLGFNQYLDQYNLKPSIDTEERAMEIRDLMLAELNNTEVVKSPLELAQDQINQLNATIVTLLTQLVNNGTITQEQVSSTGYAGALNIDESKINYSDSAYISKLENELLIAKGVI